jgi:hypothetical protein
MQTETQKPQNQKNNENRPKHVNLTVRSFADSHFPTNIGHLLARFPLPQNRHDLFFRVSFLWHRPFSSPGLFCLR